MFNFIIYIHSYIPVIKKGELKEIKAIILCLVNCNTRWYFFSYYLCQIAFHFSKKVVIGQFAGRIVQVVDFNFHLLNFFKEIVHREGCDKLGIMVVLNLLSSSHLRTNGINKTQCGLENYTASSLTSINGCIPHSRS